MEDFIFKTVIILLFVSVIFTTRRNQAVKMSLISNVLANVIGSYKRGNGILMLL